MTESERTSRLAALRRVHQVCEHFFSQSPLELLTSDLEELQTLIAIEEHRALQCLAIKRERMVDKLFYFGCLGHTGHYLHDVWHRKAWSQEQRLPWAPIDAALTPDLPTEPQGIAAIHHKDGWTAVAFWDRSVDKRGKSNSAFFVAEETSFEHVMELAHLYFAPVMRRLPFDVVLP